ncbi:transcription elongation factor Spt5 [Candidatus Woesearchaeota archaeon]|jgi:transcription termination/antitermination protein NusG|nr:transcription elongation factor Spt5 [Candidatus Woesearchaeota archaeon]MBT4114362.1 transcription elongation factor Spt5 [Candidatus Woesearchaeota archaeon]MBT4248573.1 transcription elongation factor Spt5 [Candidatus Woesearchaeota archaeon]
MTEEKKAPVKEEEMQVKLYIVRTAIGREDQVMDFLSSNAKKMGSVHSLVYPHGMSGYILIEADSDTAVKQIAFRVPYVRGILPKPVSYEEVEHLIEFKAENVDIHLGDICQIIAGPFKGEKAKVTRINTQKAEIIVELLEAAVPIPITIALDSVKVIGKKDDSED